MTRTITRALVLAVPFAAAAALADVSARDQQAAPTTARGAVVTVKNPLAIARPAETIEMAVADLQRLLTFDDVRKVHVRDDALGKDLLTQAVDLNDDGTFEQVIFQAIFNILRLAPLAMAFLYASWRFSSRSTKLGSTGISSGRVFICPHMIQVLSHTMRP